MNLYRAATDKNLFGTWLKGSSWTTWLVIFKVLAAVVMTETEKALFGKISGRQGLPTSVRELWIMAGRRAGKSLVASLLAVYYACFKDWSNVLARGEIGYVLIVSPDRAQGRVVFNYAKAFIEGTPMLRALVKSSTRESITFNNNIRLEVRTASFRTIRGYTVVCVVVEEADFYLDDSSANPFAEIMTALRPCMATTGGLLVVISTPYSRAGEFYAAHQKYFGQEHPSVLFLKGCTQLFNPTIPEYVVREAYLEDPASAASEYGNLVDGIQFRSDVEGFISREVVAACVVAGRRELSFMMGLLYLAFLDVAGGSGGDSYTLGIAYRRADGVLILVLVREWRSPFSPEQVTAEAAEVVKSFGLSAVTGDKYAGEWPAEQFRKHGIYYQTSERTKSDIYREVLPLLNSGKIELLDNPRLTAQLCGLERRTTRGGKDSIDHAPGGHDDLVNAAAGALVLAATGRDADDLGISPPDGPPSSWRGLRGNVWSGHGDFGGWVRRG